MYRHKNTGVYRMQKPPDTKPYGKVSSLTEYRIKKQEQQPKTIQTLTCQLCFGNEFYLVSDSKEVICSSCNYPVQVEYTTTHITEDDTNE